MTLLIQTTRAVLVAVLASGAFASAAQAQSSSAERPAAAAEAQRGHHAGPAFGPRPGGHRFGPHGQPAPQPLFALLSARDAESIEVAAVRLTHRLELTEMQAAALETLQEAALSASAEMQAARDIARESAAQDTDRLIARYAGMVALTTARADALAALQPALEDFIEGLTDAQREKLAPRPQGPHANR